MFCQRCKEWYITNNETRLMLNVTFFGSPESFGNGRITYFYLLTDDTCDGRSMTFSRMRGLHLQIKKDSQAVFETIVFYAYCFICRIKKCIMFV